MDSCPLTGMCTHLQAELIHAQTQTDTCMHALGSLQGMMYLKLYYSYGYQKAVS